VLHGENWSTGVLEYWSIGVLEYWSIGVLEYWSIGDWGIGRLGALLYSATPELLQLLTPASRLPCEKRANREKHRTEVTEATEGGLGLGALSYPATPELLQLVLRFFRKLKKLAQAS
jgi:hypothetical protein